MPYAVRNCRRGKATIQLAGFDRGALVGKRRNFYQSLKLIYKLAQLPVSVAPESDAARLFIKEATTDTAEYASMARAAIKARFRTI